MIYARIAGTALHLNIEEKKETNQLSYKKHYIWGIKTLINSLTDDIFNLIYDNLPQDESLLNPDIHLIQALKILSKRYGISFLKVQKFIEERKKTRQIWERMENDQQTIFVINAFFEAIEESLVDCYYATITFLNFINMNLGEQPFLLKSNDFRRGDFSFIFRARGYASIFSNLVCNGGYNNTVNRINKILVKEYEETFLKIEESTKEENTLFSPDNLPEEIKYVIQMLRKGNSEEKLQAIRLIREENITEAVYDLEYLLNHQDETVMNAAFDTILKLKEL